MPNYFQSLLALGKTKETLWFLETSGGKSLKLQKHAILAVF